MQAYEGMCKARGQPRDAALTSLVTFLTIYLEAEEQKARCSLAFTLSRSPSLCPCQDSRAQRKARSSCADRGLHALQCVFLRPVMLLPAD